MSGGSGLATALFRSSQGILHQKHSLIQKLTSKFGKEIAGEKFQQVCPTVGASIGQHFRHSNDHMERAITIALDPDQNQIHYDTRTSGGADEHDIDAATRRIEKIQVLLEETNQASHTNLMDHRVWAYFQLSGDDSSEYPLPSTVARELGFAAHHAIHHLAMVRIIALQSSPGVGLDISDIPPDFGRAPSTLNFERL